MYTRRGFLGSVIGLVSSFDFFARTIYEPPQSVILPYNILGLDEASGYIIRMPAVKQIVHTRDYINRYGHVHNYTFVAESLHATQRMSITDMMLTDINNRVIAKGSIDCRRNVIPGDTLNATYTLLSIDDLSVEELTKQYFQCKVG